MSETREVYEGQEIIAHRNSWSGHWGAEFTIPGEDETLHTGYFAADARTAIQNAKAQIRRAIQAAEDGVKFEWEEYDDDPPFDPAYDSGPSWRDLREIREQQHEREDIRAAQRGVA